MARAKSTARSDARRRHRAARGLTEAELDAAELDAAEGTDDDAETGTRSGSTSRSMRTASDAIPAKVGIGAAFRLAFRPLDLRGDIAAFPWIAVRSKALWVPVALTLAATALVIAFGISGSNLQNVLTNFLFQYFVYTPAIGGVFIAGFLAPRASWLLGIAVGLVAATCFAVVVFTVPSAIYPTPLPDAAATRDLATSAFLLSPAMGALFASMAAWYRRFLALSSPNRRRRAAASPDRPDGRSRGGNSKSDGAQKAGARR